MSAEQFVEILQGDAHLEGMPDRIFNWPGPINQDRKLIFQQAFLLKYSDWDREIHNCTYRIGWRKFTDLSFLEGTLLSEQPDGYQIRRHADGTVFLFSYSGVPTFDYADRCWDGMVHTAVYFDVNGVNLLHCRHGYKVPEIEICLGLEKSVPELNRWLGKLKSY